MLLSHWLPSFSTNTLVLFIECHSTTEIKNVQHWLNRCHVFSTLRLDISNWIRLIAGRLKIRIKQLPIYKFFRQCKNHRRQCVGNLKGNFSVMPSSGARRTCPYAWSGLLFSTFSDLSSWIAPNYDMLFHGIARICSCARFLWAGLVCVEVAALALPRSVSLYKWMICRLCMCDDSVLSNEDECTPYSAYLVPCHRFSCSLSDLLYSSMKWASMCLSFLAPSIQYLCKAIYLRSTATQIWHSLHSTVCSRLDVFWKVVALYSCSAHSIFQNLQSLCKSCNAHKHLLFCFFLGIFLKTHIFL